VSPVVCVGVNVLVGVTVGVGFLVTVGVGVTVTSGVEVGVIDGVIDGVTVTVGVGVGVKLFARKKNMLNNPTVNSEKEISTVLPSTIFTVLGVISSVLPSISL